MLIPVDLVRVELRVRQPKPAALELVLPGGAMSMRCVLVRDGVQQHEFQLSWLVAELHLSSQPPCLHEGGRVELVLRDGSVISKELSAGTLTGNAPVQVLGGDQAFQV